MPGNHPELFKLLNYGTIINEGFIWGWDTPSTDSSGQAMEGDRDLANTGDTRTLAPLAGSLVAFAASSALLVLARRRLRSR